MATEQRTSGAGELTQAQQVCQFNVSARLMSGDSAKLQEEVFCTTTSNRNIYSSSTTSYAALRRDGKAIYNYQIA